MSIRSYRPQVSRLHSTRPVSGWSGLPVGRSAPICSTLRFGLVRILRMEGTAHRPGLFQCRDCRGQFTVLTGSVMERSHVPLPKWVLAIHLMTSSKEGHVRAHQLHRMLDVTYNTGWFMFHRLREAMRDPTPPVARRRRQGR